MNYNQHPFVLYFTFGYCCFNSVDVNIIFYRLAIELIGKLVNTSGLNRQDHLVCLDCSGKPEDTSTCHFYNL